MADAKIVISAEDRTAAAFASIERSLSKTAMATTKLASNMLKLAGVGSLMAFFKKGAEGTDKWRDEMARLDAVTQKFFNTAAETGILDSMIAAVKTATVAAIGGAMALETLGKGIGAVAAASVALVTGKFSEAKNILKDFGSDAENTYRRFTTISADMYAAAPRGSAPARGKIDDTESKEQERLQQQVIALDESLLGQEQRLQLSYDQRSMMLEDAWMRDIISTETYQQIQQQLELDHQAKLGDASAKGILQRQKLEQMTAGQQVAFYFGSLQKITQGAAAHNRSMFELNKVAGIANAVIAANQGAAEALKWGYPMGPIFAGIIWAAAAANIAQIQSAQFGTSTSAPSVAGGTAIPVQPVEPIGSALSASASQQSPNIIQVTIQGNVFGNEEFVNQTLIPALQDAINDRSVVIIQSGSRQAQELVT